MLLGTDKECDYEVLTAFAEFEEIFSVSSIEL